MFHENSIYFFLIPERRQGKYSNNFLKLNVENDMLTYRSTQKDIVFKVQFHKYKDELYARVNEKHNSPDKAVAYELMDYGILYCESYI